MSNASAGPRLTDEQQAALAAGQRSVSLAAGAGSGKTTVLTERFLTYVDPTSAGSTLDLSALVAITFTDAAAREMRARVRRRCWERFQSATEPAEASAWQKLLRALDAAQISTIHGFCSQLLRRHAIPLGIDPQFDMLEESAADLLRSQTVDDCLRELLETRDDTVLELAAFRGLKALRDDLVRLIAATPGPTIARWHDASPDELLAAWKAHYEQSYLPGQLRKLVDAPAYATFRAAARLELAGTDRLRDHLAAMSELFAQLETGDVANEPWLRLREMAKSLGPCSKSNWIDASVYEQFRDAAKPFRDVIDGLYRHAEPCGDDAAEAARLGLNLLRIAAVVDGTYDERKRQQSALDFDDLLHYAHRLATDPANAAIQQDLTASLKILMVDEFQDTDPVQAAIVEALCGTQWRDSGLFVVGDYKQSIYRFRGADPQVSIQLRRQLPEPGRLSLTRNFRSQPAILDFVNALFHDLFDEPYEPLRAARPQTGPTPAIEFLLTADPEQDDQAGPPLKVTSDMRRAREATWIAKRLRQMIDSRAPVVVDETPEGPQARPAEVGDVALLLRSLSDVATYEEALRQEGLDYYLIGGHAFYAQQEIYDLLHLLRAVESRADELSLAGALRSPLFALTDETLFWLVEDFGSLNRGLKADAVPVALPAVECEKLQRARATLARLRSEKDRLLVADLLELAIAETGYDAVVLGEFLGERKLANVQKLIEQARTLDRTSPGDLTGFITHLAEFTVRLPKEAPAATQSEVAAVRIMTIHQAKGLEFPIVVLADLDRQLPRTDPRPVFDPELGPLIQIQGSREATGFNLHQAAEKAAEAEERKRLLYVGCTRAADYLILSSSMKQIDRPEHDWLKQIDARFELATGELRAPLPAGYRGPAIRVTQEMPTTGGGDQRRVQRVRLGETIAEVRQQLAVDPLPGDVASPASRVLPSSGGRRSYSFSQLSGDVLRADALPANDPTETHPADEPRSSVPARQLGQLVHGVLERIDLNRPEEAARWCRLLSSAYLDAPSEEAEQEATRLVEQFLQSSRGEAVRQAPVVRREVEFLLPWAAPTPRHWYGVIDCLYCDAAGAWRVLDYKSNQTRGNEVAATAAKYELQMFVYAEAAAQALGVAPVECVLYFVRPGVEHRFQWDAKNRTRCLDLLDAAMNQETTNRQEPEPLAPSPPRH